MYVHRFLTPKSYFHKFHKWNSSYKKHILNACKLTINIRFVSEMLSYDIFAIKWQLVPIFIIVIVTSYYYFDAS